MVLTGATGPGIVSTNDTGPWTAHFAICAFEDVTLQSAQGGTSAWTFFVSAISNVYNASGALVDATNRCALRKATGGGNKVELCEWGTEGRGNSYTGGINLPNGAYATIDVTVNGTVKPSQIGFMLNITGAWSALYYLGLDVTSGTLMKTDYTTLAYVQVGP